MDIWIELGIAETNEIRKIKRAYASKLKKTHPEDNPEGFQILRDAYENAIYYAENAQDERDNNVDFINTADNEFGNAVTPIEHKSVIDSETTDNNLESEVLPEQLQAQSYLTEIADALSNFNESDAIEKLQFAVSQPELDHIDIRLWFEINIVLVICNQENFPFNFAFNAFDIFRWEEDWRHLYDSIQNEAQYVIGRVQTKQKFIELQTNDTSNSVFTARNSLFGKYRPLLFSIRALSKKNKDAVQILLDEIQHVYPALFEYELNEKITYWWQTAINKIHFGWFHIYISILFACSFPGFSTSISNSVMDVVGKGIGLLLFCTISLSSVYFFVTFSPTIKKIHNSIKFNLISNVNSRIVFVVANILILMLGYLLDEKYAVILVLLMTILSIIIRGINQTIKISLIALVNTVVVEEYSKNITFLSSIAFTEFYLYVMVSLILVWFIVTSISLKATLTLVKLSDKIDKLIYLEIVKVYRLVYRLVIVISFPAFLLYAFFTILTLFKNNAEEIKKFTNMIPIVGIVVSETFKVINNEPIDLTQNKYSPVYTELDIRNMKKISEIKRLMSADNYWFGNGVTKDRLRAYQLILDLEKDITHKVIENESYVDKRNRMARLTNNQDLMMLDK